MTAVKSQKRADHSSSVPTELREYASLSALRGNGSVGYIYRAGCSCGAIYAGMSERLNEKSIDHYAGSGQRWMDHARAHTDHSVAKTILCWSDDALELRLAETELIVQYLAKYGSLVLNLRKGGVQGSSCIECGAFGRHSKECSSHVAALQKTPPCGECQGKANHHRKICSQYFRELAFCEECSTTAPGHIASCTKNKSCTECGSKNYRVHFTTCSSYRETRSICDHCGSRTLHRSDCPNNPRRPCEECGSKGQIHANIYSRSKKSKLAQSKIAH